MLINNVNINNFNCKVLKFEPSTTNLKSEGGFWSSSLIPIKSIHSESYRDLKISFLYNLKREDVLKCSSKLIEHIKSSNIFYKNLFYEVELSDKPNLIRKNFHTYILELQFNILNVCESEKIVTTNTSTIINIESSKPCYANLEIAANTNVISVVISINDIDITVKNIKGNETVYISSGKVLAGGKSKIDDVDIWEFPILKPGSNTIKVSREDVNLTVKYNERW